MTALSVFLLILAAVLLLGLVVRIIRLPIKWALKALLHAAAGFAALFILNFVGAWIDLSLEMNFVNALITGVFGVPGVIFLLVFKYVI